MTYEELLKIGLGAVPAGYDTSENSFIHQAVSAAAIMAHEILIRLEYVESMQWSDNWSGDILDRRVYDATGLVRRPATRAAGKVKIILAKDAFVTPDNLRLEYNGFIFSAVYSDQVKANVETEIPFECETPGNIGPVPADSLRPVPPSELRITSIRHEALIPGADKESDTSLKMRYREFYTDHAVTNNPAQFRQWALEVPGVGQARVLRASAKPGCVTVYILTSDYGLPTKELLDKVEANILKNCGFDIYELVVASPKPKEIKIRVRGKLAPNVATSEAQEALQAAVKEYLTFYPDPNYVMHSLYKYELASAIQKAGVLDNLIEVVDIDNPGAISWTFEDSELAVVKISEVTNE